MSETKRVKVSRDAKTGRFVSKKTAKENPDTTVTETVEKKKKEKPA